MYLESFHKVLKYVYPKGQANKRMDKCVYVLMKYSRDKAFDRVLKLEKGKSTKRHSEIAKRHRNSMLLSFSQIKSTSDTQWSIESSNKPITYTVERCIENECEGCWLVCQACGICIHSFSCTCHDSLLHGSICKHIHLVARFITSKVSHCDAVIPTTANAITDVSRRDPGTILQQAWHTRTLSNVNTHQVISDCSSSTQDQQ